MERLACRRKDQLWMMSALALEASDCPLFSRMRSDAFVPEPPTARRVEHGGGTKAHLCEFRHTLRWTSPQLSSSVARALAPLQPRELNQDVHQDQSLRNADHHQDVRMAVRDHYCATKAGDGSRQRSEPGTFGDAGLVHLASGPWKTLPGACQIAIGTREETA
jgi:hypothetical protein